MGHKNLQRCFKGQPLWENNIAPELGSEEVPPALEEGQMGTAFVSTAISVRGGGLCRGPQGETGTKGQVLLEHCCCCC